MSFSKTNQVFVLILIAHYVTQDGDIEVISKADPKSVVFDEISKLYVHLMELVYQHIGKYEDRFALPLMKYREDMNFHKFILLWRHAQKENGRSTGFDAFWDEKSQVVL